jgi:hypothetical protein
VLVGVLAQLFSPVFVVLLRHHDRHLQALALCRQDIPPIADEFLVGLAYRTDLAVEIVQPDRVDNVVVFPQSDAPIHLVS